jgi:cell shape-determining protein MreC
VADNLIQALEKKVNDLIELSRELNRENRALKLRAAELQRESRELLGATTTCQ